MNRESTHEAHPNESNRRGLGNFLRSLLSGIPWSDRAECTEEFELDAPRDGIVKIHNANGRTRVVGEDREDICVRAQKTARAESNEAAEALLDAIHVNAERSGEELTLEVEIPRKWNRHGNVNLEVLMPRALRVSVTAANGKLCLEGLRRSIRVRSSNGSVHVADVVGDVEVFTSNAKVCCRCTCGRLLARSSNGKIELAEHRGSIDASTSNGLIHACLEAVGREGVVLATSNGRILLELPEDVDADLDMRVENGVIRNERELTACDRDTNGQVRGRLGRGGSAIKLRTSNGTISLR